MSANPLYQIAQGVGPEWEELRKAAPYTLFQTPAWTQTWMELYGSGRDAVVLLAGSGPSNYSALFPFMRRKQFGSRVIQFLSQSGGFSCDYPGAIVRPGSERVAFDSLFKWLTASEDWDILDLEIPGWSPFLSDFMRSQVLRAPEWSLDAKVKSFCIRVNLPDSFETYLEGLGTTTRRDVRKFNRVFEAIGGTFEIFRGSEILHHLEGLYRLNGLNWAVFETDKARRLWWNTIERGVSDELDFWMPSLSAEGQVVATVLCIRVNDVLYVHPAGVDRSERRYSPGLVLYSRLIEQLITDGLRILDLSPGLEEYKVRLGGVIWPKYSLRLARNRKQMNRYKWQTDLFLRLKRSPVLQKANRIWRSLHGR